MRWFFLALIVIFSVNNLFGQEEESNSAGEQYPGFFIAPQLDLGQVETYISFPIGLSMNMDFENWYAGLYMMTEFHDIIDNKNKEYDLNDFKLNQYGLSGGYRMILVDNIYFTPEMRLGLGFLNTKHEIYEEDETDKVILINPGVSFEFILNENMRIAPGISYRFAFGTELWGVKNNDISSLLISVVFKYGKFATKAKE